MKKTITALLAMVLLMTLTACSGADPDNGDDPAPFTFGTVAEKTYENSYLGLGCTLDDDWNYCTVEEMLVLNELTAESSPADIAARIQFATQLADMVAVHKNGSDNVYIALTKGSALQMTMQASDLANSFMNKKRTELEELRFDSVESTTIPVTVAGEETYAVRSIAKMRDIEMHQMNVLLRRGEYIVSIDITAMNEETLNTVKDAFYAI